MFAQHFALLQTERLFSGLVIVGCTHFVCGRFHAIPTKGAAHPALLCAKLYATHLKDWETAAYVAEGLLAIRPHGDGVNFGLEPLARIEAWMLLARCKTEGCKLEEARGMLNQAILESEAVGYVWLKEKAERMITAAAATVSPLREAPALLRFATSC